MTTKEWIVTILALLFAAGSFAAVFIAPFDVLLGFLFTTVALFAFLAGSRSTEPRSKATERKSIPPYDETNQKTLDMQVTVFKSSIKVEIANIEHQFYELAHQDEIPNLQDGAGFSRNGINYSVWVGKSDDEKVKLLGYGDYRILGNFYDAIEERNERLSTRPNPEEMSRLNQSCIDAYNRVIRKVSWVRPAATS